MHLIVPEERGIRMIRFTATNAVISWGFVNRAAIKYFRDSNVVRFRISEHVFEKNVGKFVRSMKSSRKKPKKEKKLGKDCRAWQ